jgi:hypothetical protein
MLLLSAPSSLQYAQSLWVWLALYIFSFTVYMLVTGVTPAVDSRCGTRSFAADYGRNCLDNNPDHFAACYQRCQWEMRINLLIETTALAAVVAALITFLAWDASRVQAAMVLWRYHPCRSEWHADLMLFNRYADCRRYSELDEAPTDESAASQAKSPADKKGAPTLASSAKGESKAPSQGERKDSGGVSHPTSQTYGSGMVGEGSPSTTTRRRKGALQELRSQEREHAGERF